MEGKFLPLNYRKFGMPCKVIQFLLHLPLKNSRNSNWNFGQMENTLQNSNLTIFENNIQEYYPDLVRNAMDIKQNKKDINM